jgi:uncharacterized membrane protein
MKLFFWQKKRMTEFNPIHNIVINEPEPETRPRKNSYPLTFCDKFTINENRNKLKLAILLALCSIFNIISIIFKNIACLIIACIFMVYIIYILFRYNDECNCCC